MKVVSKKEIAEELSTRSSIDADRASRGVDAALEMMKGKLKDGIGLRLESFADIQIQNGESQAEDTPWTVPSDESAGAVAENMQLSPDEARGFLSGLLQVMSESLLGGNRIELDQFLSLNIAEEKAGVRRDEQGKRIITPARKIISFSLDPGLKTEMGDDKKLTFTPDPDLREQIARLKTSTIILVIPEEDFFAKTLEFHFRKAGWNVDIATDTEAALAKIESGDAYQVILDDPIPDSQKLLERIKCHPETSRLPTIAMLPSGQDPNRTDAFRICSDQSIVQPFEVKALLDKAETELARMAEEEAIFRQEVHFKFSTQAAFIDRANEVGAQLFERSGLDDEGQVALCAAFREAIGNAAQHGNRHRRDKIIDILYLLDDEKITASVTDEGQGFDHRLYTQRGAGGNALMAARERHQQGRLGGLGIMLMMKCTDRLEYNEKGNSVTLTKLLAKKDEASEA